MGKLKNKWDENEKNRKVKNISDVIENITKFSYLSHFDFSANQTENARISWRFSYLQTMFVLIHPVFKRFLGHNQFFIPGCVF